MTRNQGLPEKANEEKQDELRYLSQSRKSLDYAKR